MKRFFVPVIVFIASISSGLAMPIQIIPDPVPLDKYPTVEQIVEAMFKDSDQSDPLIQRRKKVLSENLSTYVKDFVEEGALNTRRKKRATLRKLRTDLNRQAEALKVLSNKEPAIELGSVDMRQLYRDQFTEAGELLTVIHNIDFRVGQIVLINSWNTHDALQIASGAAIAAGVGTVLAIMFSPVAYAVYNAAPIMVDQPLRATFQLVAGMAGMIPGVVGGMLGGYGVAYATKKTLNLPIKAVGALQKKWTLLRRPRIDCANLLESGKR